MDAIAEAAGDVPLVEDCAQAHGARLRGRAAGTMGALGAFSFYPAKNLGALGDGGAVVTDDDALAERLRLLRQYGQAGRYRHEIEGVNSRLDELQAAILRAKLPLLNAHNEQRRAIAGRYTAALADTPVRPLVELAERTHGFHLYVVRAGDREGFRAGLEEQGVATIVHYPVPVHRHPPYARLAEGSVGLGTAERFADEVVSLPIYPELTDDEVAHVAGAARDAAEPR
jgi:dTDP-4-amino-4,6-dideoxygalactose transaminase